MHFANERVGRKLRSTLKSTYSHRLELQPSWTPVYRISRSFTVDKRTNISKIQRMQFPLRPATASTVHHCQGLALTRGAGDFSGPPSCGKHYVGLSRFTREEDFFVLDLAPDKIRVSKSVKAEMLRMRTQAQVSLSTSCLQNEYPEVLSIVFHNCRTAYGRMEDIRSDQTFLNSDVLLLFETRALPSDSAETFSLPGFQGTRCDCPQTSSRKQGVLLFVRTCIPTVCLKMLSLDGLQILVTKLSLPTESICIAGLYRSPSFPFESFQTEVKNVLLEFSSRPLLFVGDFNMDSLNENLDFHHLRDVFHTRGFSQRVSFHTTDCGSCLDHCWTNLQRPLQCKPWKTYFSDHAAICLTIPLNPISSNRQS